MLGRIGPAIISIIGLAGVVAYVAIVAIADDRSDATTSWTGLCAFSLVVVIIGVLAWLAAARGRTQLRPPSLLLAGGLFVSALVAGFITTRTDYAIWITPFVTVIATAAVGFIFLRLLTWKVSRSVPTGRVAGSALWGMVGAPIGAASIQLLSAVAIIGAIAAGLYVYDPELARNAEIRSIFDDLGSTTTDALPAIYSTSTVAIALFVMLAFIAPFTEELLKPISALFADRGGQERTEYDAFLAGGSAGLGFGVVEALGYSLIQPEDWPTMMLLRAPIITIHVVGAALVATGWYRQRRQGGWPLVRYFATAVALHAAWNGLFASAFLVVAGMDDPAQPEPFTAIVLLVILAALGVVLLSAFSWLIACPRRIASQHDETAPSGPLHRSSTISRNHGLTVDLDAH